MTTAPTIPSGGVPASTAPTAGVHMSGVPTGGVALFAVPTAALSGSGTSVPVRGLAPLARVPMPVPGESIGSYLARVATVNRAPLGWSTAATGLAESELHEDQPAGLIVALTEDQAAVLHTATGIPEADLHAMTLAAYVGSALDVLPTRPDGTVDHRVFARDNWVHTRGTPYCPQCLADDDGVYQLVWRLPFTVACMRHACLLVADCPRCGLPPFHGHGDGTLRPGFLTVEPVAGQCANPIPYIGRDRGSGSKPCGTDLTLTPAVPATADELGMQARLLGKLDPDPDNRAFWIDMRALAATLLTVGTADPLGDLCGVRLPVGLTTVWRDYQTTRNDQRADTRRINTALNRDHRQSTRNRTWITTPKEPALVAAAALVAERILTGDDDVLHALLTSTVTGTRATGMMRLATANPTPALMDRARRVLDQHANTTRRNGYHQRTAQPSPIAALADTGIPPLLWADQYATRLEPLIAAANTAAAGEGRPAVPVNDTTLRRLASVALHKQLTAGTWHTSAEHFADQIARNKNIANATLDRLKKHTPGLADQYLTAISELAAELDTNPARMRAYPALRVAADVVLAAPVPETVYAALSAGGRVTAQRRTYAAAWAWSVLVDDHPWNAPAWGDTPPTDSDRETYRRWTQADLPGIETALEEWARDAATAVTPNRAA